MHTPVSTQIVRASARLAFALIPMASTLVAQFPTDEEVRKQIWNKGVLEIRFPKKTRGEKFWDPATRSWYWQRGLVVVRNAKIAAFPKATVEIGGLARYFITGEKVSYQKFLVTWNEYKGIPAPSHKEVVEMVRQRLPQFVGSFRYNKIVGDVSGIAVAADHGTEWHTPHSFSINLSCRYEMIVSYTETEKKDATIRVRFYRANFKSPWREQIVTTVKSEVAGEKTEHDPDAIRRMPTLGSIDANRKILAAQAALPEVEVPVFATDEELFRFTYELLRDGDAKTLEAGLLQYLAPNYYNDQGKQLLNQSGARLINMAARRAYQGKSKYKENYAEKMQVKRKQRGMIEIWNRTRQVKTRIAARQYRDHETGKLAWRLIALEPWTLSRPGDLARLRQLNAGSR